MFGELKSQWVGQLSMHWVIFSNPLCCCHIAYCGRQVGESVTGMYLSLRGALWCLQVLVSQDKGLHQGHKTRNRNREGLLRKGARSRKSEWARDWARHLLRSPGPGILWSFVRSQSHSTHHRLCVWCRLFSVWVAGLLQTGLYANLAKIHFFYFYCMCVCTWCMWGAQVALCAFGGQRTSLWSRVSPSTFTWVPGVELRSPALQDKCKDSIESTWGLHVWILLQLSPTPTLPPHTQVGFEQINKGQDGGRNGVWPTYVSWQAVGLHPT